MGSGSWGKEMEVVEDLVQLRGSVVDRLRGRTEEGWRPPIFSGVGGGSRGGGSGDVVRIGGSRAGGSGDRGGGNDELVGLGGRRL